MLRRLVPATAVTALLLTAGLTGCSAQQSQSEDCSSTLQPGAFTSNLTITGAVGEMPQVQMPKGVDVSKLQGGTVVRAKDRSSVAVPDSLVGVDFVALNAGTGEVLQASPGFTDAGAAPQMLLVSDQSQDVVSEAVRCAAPGDRIAFALPPQGAGQPSVVGIADVRTVSPMRAEGRAHGLPSGFPAVVTDEEGQPGIVLPPGDAPAKTVSASRIVGDGEKVTAEDMVIGQVMTVSWAGEQLLNSRSDQKTGIGFGTEADIPQSGYLWRTELTGKTVGSQVVILDENNGSPQVVVVDIVGVA